MRSLVGVDRKTRLRPWMGRGLAVFGMLALPVTLYANVRSCSTSVAIDNAPIDAGSVTVSPFSIAGCSIEYGMLDGSVERVFSPVGFTLLALAAIVLGVIIALTSRHSSRRAHDLS